MSDLALKTDLYEFTMLQSALESGVAHRKGVFELFNRRLPNGRKYAVTAGTARVIEAIPQFHFDETDLKFLSEYLNSETIDYLRNFSFQGTVYGYPEGELFFPFSPLLTIEATFGEAVLLETLLLSIMNYDSAVASAASRLRAVAKGLTLNELGSRRVNEDAAAVAARAAYIGGFDGTSNVLAAKLYGVPVYGTAAHAFTLANESEKEAFAAQIRALGIGTTLLVDTYDIEQGIRNAVEVAGPELGAIRIDSGDPQVEIPSARTLLDSLGAPNTRIIFSGDVDYDILKEIADSGIPCDGLGIGSSVVTGDGHPSCGFVYKLVEMEYADGEMHPVAKKASGKASIGGRKRVYRAYDDDWNISEEHIFTYDPDGTEVKEMTRIQEVFIQNGRVVKLPTAEEARERHTASLQMFSGNDVEVVIHTA